MIRTVHDIKINASNPLLPLKPWNAFVGSAASIRITDVPKKIGNWVLERLWVDVKYPSDIEISREAKRTNGVYIATIDASTVYGQVRQGYQICASGKDEDGDPIERYVLGVGDVNILKLPHYSSGPDTVAQWMRMYDERPDTPMRGDAVIEDGKLKVYDGSVWVESSGATMTSQLTNDAGFITDKQVKPGKTPGYASDAEWASKALSATDAENVPWEGVSGRPTKVSDFLNDKDYLTPHEVTLWEGHPGAVDHAREAENAHVASLAGQAESVEWENVNNHPTKLSQFENDEAFVSQTSDVFVHTTGGTMTGDLRVGDDGHLGHVLVQNSKGETKVRLSGEHAVEGGENYGGELELTGNVIGGGGRIAIGNGAYGGGELDILGTKGGGRASLNMYCADAPDAGTVKIRSGSNEWEGSQGFAPSLVLTDNLTDPAKPLYAEVTIGGVKVRDTLAKKADKTALDELNTSVTNSIAKKADKATTLAGYGITDSPTKVSQLENDNGYLTTTEVKLGTTPGYVANADHCVSALGAVDSETVPWSGVKFHPTTLDGYGITDAATKAELTALDAKVETANTKLEGVA